MYGRGLYSPMMGMPYINNIGMTPKAGLIGKLGNAFGSIKGVNWSGLFTNAGKALNVVNQTIPIVKQAGPMVKNMKSMLKVATAFRDETDKNPKIKRTSSNNYIKKNQTNNSNNTNNKDESHINQYTQNTPNFFIE